MFDLKVGDNVKLNNDGVSFSQDQVEDNLKQLFNTRAIYEINKITYDVNACDDICADTCTCNKYIKLKGLPNTSLVYEEVYKVTVQSTDITDILLDIIK